MKLVWLTDIHLNFLKTDALESFYRHVARTACDGVLITGDIAEAPSLSATLKELKSEINAPIYFVLGNHDYYHGKIAEVRSEMIALTESEKDLHWLPASGSKFLSKKTVLVGQDGWADGRYGDIRKSQVVLNDSRLIQDLFQNGLISKEALLEKMQALSDEDAENLRCDLLDSVNQHHPQEIMVLLHVPPFKEACLYQGKVASNDYLPYFSSKAMGDVLLAVAGKNQHIKFSVFCGHTHEAACYQALDNLVVNVGQAQYLDPQVQEVIPIRG